MECGLVGMGEGGRAEMVSNSLSPLLRAIEVERGRLYDGADVFVSAICPGETVLTHAQQRSISLPSPSSTPITVTIKLDDRDIARAVTRYNLQRAARGPSQLVGGSLVTGGSSDV